jgi:hypothetical protein
LATIIFSLGARELVDRKSCWLIALVANKVRQQNALPSSCQHENLGMKRKRASMTLRAAMMICLTACAALIGWAIWATVREPLLARYWENELTAEDTHDAEEIIERLLTLGRSGKAAVVRALGHSCDHVGHTAYEALDRCFNCMEGRPSSDAVAELEDMAQVLADNADDLLPAGRVRAAALTMRILHWSRNAPSIDVGRVVANCDRVLRTVDEPSDRRSQSDQNSPTATMPAAVSAKVVTSEQTKNVVQAHTVLPADHSMYLELAELVPPRLPRADAMDTNPTQPRLLLLAEAKPLNVARNSTAPPRTNEIATASYEAQEDSESQAKETAARLDPLALFAQLNEPALARAAAAELVARRFSARQIEVGKHLLSPDPAERLQWAEALPGIRGIDARYWLLRLSHDTNIQVRRAAIGLLATDRDPEVVRRLRQITVDETDPDLRDQAARALDVLDGEP